MSIRSYFLSPVGYITITTQNKTLTDLVISKYIPDYDSEQSNFNDSVIEQLREYFAGKRKEFVVEINFEKGTDFQKAVWVVLKNIRYGETVSYSEIAGIIGNFNAQRAVGSAVGKNPVPIILPCHRVIKSDGRTGNFAYGETMKQTLLCLEKNHAEKIDL